MSIFLFQKTHSPSSSWFPCKSFFKRKESTSSWPGKRDLSKPRSVVWEARYEVIAAILAWVPRRREQREVKQSIRFKKQGWSALDRSGLGPPFSVWGRLEGSQSLQPPHLSSGLTFPPQKHLQRCGQEECGQGSGQTHSQWVGVVVLYCYITNYHKFTGLEQHHVFFMVSLGQESGRDFAGSPVGRIQFLASVGLLVACRKIFRTSRTSLRRLAWLGQTYSG